MVSQTEAALLIEWLQGLRLEQLYRRNEPVDNALAKLTQEEVNWCLHRYQSEWDWCWRPRARKEVFGCDGRVFAHLFSSVHVSKRWRP